MAATFRRARLYDHVVRRGLNYLRGALDSFRSCRKGTAAVKVALMIGVPMILIDAAVDVGRWLNEDAQTFAANEAARCQQVRDKANVSRIGC